MTFMAANERNSAATHFGRQMKKERLAHGWSLREFAARTGIDFTTVSRIENGRRPPTQKGSAWCEHVKGGYVYTGESVTALLTLFDTLRGECYRVSESTALFERMTGIWTHGARAATQTPTAARASK